MTKINEGLRPFDLRGMVRNVVGVDQYESKIDDTAMVISFYVNQLEAAKDVNRFIQKSYVDLLDTEVSASPDQMGYYMVFVEMPMNDKSAQAIANLCDDLNSLADVSEWVVEVRGSGASEPMKASDIEGFLRKKIERLLSEHFMSSGAHVRINESAWEARNEFHQLLFKLDDFGTFKKVIERNNLHESAIDLSPEATRTCRSIKSIFGAGWTVEKLGENFVVYNNESDHIALIRI